MGNNSNIDQLTDHLFRQTSGKMVSVLTRIFGTDKLEIAEDVVQQTFIDALNIWKLKGVPENPSGWLLKVAKNKTIDIIRREKHLVHYDFEGEEKIVVNSEYTLTSTIDFLWKEELIKDDLLRMMFACCTPEISQKNQVTLILKTLCGFSTIEIAKAFLTTEDNISKRLYRTKEFFRSNKIKLSIPSVSQLKVRIHSVLNAIYLLFNEGYNSTNASQIIRQNLIDEAIMLCNLLIDNEHTKLPIVYALMSLMRFHSARSKARLTYEGEIILLQNQDRFKWDSEQIRIGIYYLNKASVGEEISTYHLEAAIAYEHCISESYDQTNWERILEMYNLLCKVSASPIYILNRSIVILQVLGPEKSLESLSSIKEHKIINSYYLYHCLLGEIYLKLCNMNQALDSFNLAIKFTKSDIEKKIIMNKIENLKL